MSENKKRMRVTVRELQEGDLVDLKSCPFLAKEQIANFEYGEVGSIVQKSPECWVVRYDNVSLMANYLPDHVLSIRRPTT